MKFNYTYKEKKIYGNINFTKKEGLYELLTKKGDIKLILSSNGDIIIGKNSRMKYIEKNTSQGEIPGMVEKFLPYKTFQEFTGILHDFEKSEDFKLMYGYFEALSEN